MHTEGHDMGKADPARPTCTQAPKSTPSIRATRSRTSTSRASRVFLAGLFGTVIIFFFFCYAMGKLINNMWGSRTARPPSGRLKPQQCSRGQGRGPDEQRGDRAEAVAADHQQLPRSRGWISTTATRRPPTCTRAKICCWSTTAWWTASRAPSAFPSSARWS